jgi:hypothetical protein
MELNTLKMRAALSSETLAKPATLKKTIDIFTAVRTLHLTLSVLFTATNLIH